MKKNIGKKFLESLIKVGTFIILLEPFWMLLPFASFLYGSVLNLNFLASNHYTAWLLYFIFPVQSFRPLPTILFGIGLIIFLMGAAQIYMAKFRKTGLVKTGLYKYFRNPQYTALTLICLAFLMIWGRFITYLLFLLMMYLYFQLAKKEENVCLRLFGNEYEEYKKNTYFLFPGEKIFQSIAKNTIGKIKNLTVRNIIGFAVLMICGLIVCFTILNIRRSSFTSIPVIERKVKYDDKDLDTYFLGGFNSHKWGIPLDVMKKRIPAIINSAQIKRILSELNIQDQNALFGYVIPRTVREQKPYYKKGRTDIYFLVLKNNDPLKTDMRFQNLENWDVTGAIQINKLNAGKFQQNEQNFIEGDVKILQPRAGESEEAFLKRQKMILNLYLYSYNKNLLDVSKYIEK